MKSCIKHAASAAAVLLLAACASRVQQRPQPGAPAPQQPSAAAPAGAPVVINKGGTPDERVDQALQLLKNKKRKDAQDAFLSLAQDYPQYSGPLCNVGVLYAESKQHGQAIAAFSKAVEDNPRNSFAYDWLGVLYRENGNYPLAEQSYQKAISLEPGNATAHLNLAILYDDYLQRPQEAMAQYKEYQHIAGTDRAIVTVWMNELQDRLAPPPAGQTAAPGSPPALEQR